MANHLFNALALHPERPALRSNTQSLCAGELLQLVDALASHLHDVRVLAVLADNGISWVALDLAAMRAGIVHLPLPRFFSPDQMIHALENAGVDTVLSDTPECILALNLGFERSGELAGLAALRRKTTARPLPMGTSKISFTSGSTGRPRGVCLSATGLMKSAEAVNQALISVPLTRHLAVLPLALLLENVAGVYAALLQGAEVFLPGVAELGWRGMAGFDPLTFLNCTQTLQPSSVILVPELLKAWCLALEASPERMPTSLKFVAVGGAKVSQDLLLRAKACGLPAYEGYGLTECGSVICLNLPDSTQPGSVGRPLAHVRLRLDSSGEIHATGQLALGYLGEEPFPLNPDGTGDIATGDLGRIDAEGFVYLNGRRNHLIITAYGRNISPEWVEAALTAQPEIFQALVVGEAQPELSALIVPMPGVSGVSTDPTDISRAVARANATLPDYARVRCWSIVPPFQSVAGLLTGNGRLIRKAALAHYAQSIESLFNRDNQENTHVIL